MIFYMHSFVLQYIVSFMCEFRSLILSISLVFNVFVRRQSFPKYLERTPQITDKSNFLYQYIPSPIPLNNVAGHFGYCCAVDIIAWGLFDVFKPNIVRGKGDNYYFITNSKIRTIFINFFKSCQHILVMIVFFENSFFL